MFLILWPLALWMLSSWREGKDEYTRWIALFLIAGGGGSYFYLIQSELVPQLPDTGIWEPSLSFFVKATVVLAMYGYYHLIPYFFLMSGIAMNMREQNVRRAAAGLAVIPILSLLLQMPSHPHELDIEALRLWAVPYLILGCMLYVMGWVREGRPDHRKNRFRLGVIFVPIVAWVVVKEFLYTDWVGLLPTGVVLDNPGWSITGNPVELWLLLLLLIYSIRYGILGIRVRIERHRMDSSMRTMAYGTTLLNHSIKNEVSKVNFLLERLETQAEAGKLDAIQESAKQIRSVTRQLQHMSDKMKEQSGDIVLKEEQVIVAELIDRLLEQVEPVAAGRGIRLVKKLNTDAALRCDPLHLLEALSNLAVNAVEATETVGGIVTIEVNRLGRQLAFDVRDQGKGIDRASVQHIFDPFYTTKRHTNHNYGLGLSHAYHIAVKHRGSLILKESRVGEGTVFRLMLPRKRILAWRPVIEEGGEKTCAEN